MLYFYPYPWQEHFLTIQIDNILACLTLGKIWILQQQVCTDTGTAENHKIIPLKTLHILKHYE